MPPDAPALEPSPPEPLAPESRATLENCPLDFGLAETPGGRPGIDEPRPALLELPPPEPRRVEPPPIPSVVDVHDPDWERLDAEAATLAVRARAADVVEPLERRLAAEGGLRLLFDESRSCPDDRVPHVAELSEAPLWFVGDLHGDLLALEAALATIRRETEREHADTARIVLLGDLFDDGGYGLETLLRVFELVLERPESVCWLAGNHDEALGHDGTRFTTTVSPSHFSEYLNDHLADAWAVRAGKLAIRIAARLPRALFFPDGLLAAHGGFPLADLHTHLAATSDWNDPRCLTDFVWARAHPRARKKLPNRTARGSQFGYEDFGAFCRLSASLGRPVTHMIRGHDHVDERYEIYPAYADTPVLTTVALSRRLGRELYGPYVRIPTIARWVRGALPQVHRLHLPEPLVRRWYPEESRDAAATEAIAP